ncbi:unnamed protein product [Meloidogyne enterolobii]|uniref:Uncharacterized protein n=1 Tax=Meloidogyne enterolobii TaxID=390850 RepID=A0ACB0YSX4_MELEN
MAMFNADFVTSGCSSAIPSPTSSPSSARALSEGNAAKKGRGSSTSHYENVASSIVGIRVGIFRLKYKKGFYGVVTVRNMKMKCVLIKKLEFFN